jgi:hypothetical protein
LAPNPPIGFVFFQSTWRYEVPAAIDFHISILFTEFNIFKWEAKSRLKNGIATLDLRQG